MRWVSQALNPSYGLTSDGSLTYCYDAENRLIAAIGAGTCAAPTTTVATYAFDAQGRRKTKTVNGTTTVFVTDADNREVLEYDGSTGAIQRWYAYGLGPNAVLSQMNAVAATRVTLIPDILGSVIGSLDSGSASLTKVGYLPYGRSASAGPFGFTGQRIDLETGGLYYYRARHYSPAWGRFLQPDPIGYRGGLNYYAYVNNDPLNSIDPFGLEAQYSLGVGSTVAILFAGVGGSLSVGISVPDKLSNLGGYQLFATLQGNAMGGVGLYGGAGVTGGISGSQGPLQAGLSGSKGLYIEGDIGSGVSAGASIQGDSSGGSIGFSPAPHVGLGYGAWFGAGGFASGTVATPTFGQIYNGLNSLICPSCSSTNAGAGNPLPTASGSAGLGTDVTTPALGPDAGTITNIPQPAAPSK